MPQERGRIRVSGDLFVPGVPGVWAVGDCAAVPNRYDGQLAPLPTIRRKVRIFVAWTWCMFFPTDVTHRRFAGSHAVMAAEGMDRAARKSDK